MGLIESVAQPYPVKRYAEGGWVDGRWADPEPTDITVALAVQPARPTEVANLPEGIRTKGAITLYSETPMQAADEHARCSGDVVTYDGRDWQVHSTAKYEGFGLLAYKAIAVAVDLPPEEA